jgi:hypothetical protein
LTQIPECGCRAETVDYRNADAGLTFAGIQAFRHVRTYDFSTSHRKNNTISSRLWTCSSLYTLRPVVANSTSMLEKYSYSASIQIRLFNSMSASELDAF